MIDVRPPGLLDGKTERRPGEPHLLEALRVERRQRPPPGVPAGQPLQLGPQNGRLQRVQTPVVPLLAVDVLLRLAVIPQTARPRRDLRAGGREHSPLAAP